MMKTGDNGHSYVCVNCGGQIKELCKRYSSTVKAINCDVCHKIADKYIEFEPVIIIVDAMLLSQQVYRHAIYNRDFKLFWKLSLILLLLESLTLWRDKREQLNSGLQGTILSHEHGFYFCCAQKICDMVVSVVLLAAVTQILRPKLIAQTGWQQYCFRLFKANNLANFSKFFLLPIMLWRENTTEFGVLLHRTLVTAHHLCSLAFVYKVVSHVRTMHATLIVISVYALKEFIVTFLSQYMESYF